MRPAFPAGPRIDARRGMGPWAGLVVAGATTVVTPELVTGGVVLWREVSEGLQFSLILVGPVVGAAAAWTAGREARTSTGELLTSLPRPPSNRDLSALGALVTWASLGYLLPALGFLLWAAAGAHWGGPDVELLTSGYAALIACAPLGFLIGRLAPSVVTAPLVALLLYGVMALIVTYASSARLLIPVYDGQILPFNDIRPVIGIVQTVWFGALACAFTGLLWALGSPLRRQGFMAAGVGTVLAAAAATALLGLGSSRGEARPLSFQHVCDHSGILVCLHPAYRDLLAEVAPIVRRVAAPLIHAGIDVREARQHFYRNDTLVDGTTLFSLAVVDGRYDYRYTSMNVAVALATGRCPRDLYADRRAYGRVYRAQQALAGFLLERSGTPRWNLIGRGARKAAQPLLHATTERQGAWLRANANGLRSCKVVPADLKLE